MNENDFAQVWNRIVAESREVLKPKLRELLAPYESDPNELISRCYGCSNKSAARMLHTLQRLIEFADKSETDHLKVFWSIVCAEAIMGFQKDCPKRNKQRAINFFRFAAPKDQEELQKSVEFSLGNKEMKFSVHYLGETKERAVNIYRDTSIKLDEIAGLLYKVRSQLVHEGIYYDFNFGTVDGTPTINLIDISLPNQPENIKGFEVTLTYETLRSIVIRTTIMFIKRTLKHSEPSES